MSPFEVKLYLKTELLLKPEVNVVARFGLYRFGEVPELRLHSKID